MRMDRKASRNQRKHFKTKKRRTKKLCLQRIWRQFEKTKFVTLWETALNLKKETKPIGMGIAFLGRVYSDVPYWVKISGKKTKPRYQGIHNNRLSATILLCLVLFLKPHRKYSDSQRCYSVPQSSLTLCDPMDFSTPGFPVLHSLPGLA